MNIEVIPRDTTPEAAQVQLQIYRQMDPSRRLELAMEMSNNLRENVASGVRSRHPNYTEVQVRMAVMRLMLGDALFRQVHPNVDIDI